MAVAVLLTAGLTLVVAWKAGRQMQRVLGSRGSYRATKALVPAMRKAHYATIPRALGYLVTIATGLIVLLMVATGAKLPKLKAVTPAQLPTVPVSSPAKNHPAKPTVSPHWPHFDPHKTAPPFVRNSHGL